MMATVASSTAAPAAVASAPPQGGVLEGINPAQYDPKQPVVLFIIQVCTCTFCHDPTIHTEKASLIELSMQRSSS